ncbi:MAG TPA: PAC2 family protein [Streptosporangiaceae bacterium]
MIIAAFEGWNDAGEAASAAITHLSTAWQATPIGAIDPEDYYDFQVTRPVTEVAEGKSQRLIWPTTRLLVTAVAARLAPWSGGDTWPCRSRPWKSR